MLVHLIPTATACLALKNVAVRGSFKKRSQLKRSAPVHKEVRWTLECRGGASELLSYILGGGTQGSIPPESEPLPSPAQENTTSRSGQDCQGRRSYDCQTPHFSQPYPGFGIWGRETPKGKWRSHPIPTSY